MDDADVFLRRRRDDDRWLPRAPPPVSHPPRKEARDELVLLGVACLYVRTRARGRDMDDVDTLLRRGSDDDWRLPTVA